jgi:hypothetical protein
MNIEIRFNGSPIFEQSAQSIEEAEWLIDGYSASDAYDWCADEDADADWYAAKEKARTMYSVHVLGRYVL